MPDPAPEPDALTGVLTFGLRASVGIAVSEPGLGGDALVARADAAMYAAKRRAADGPVLYTAQLSDATEIG